MSLRTTYTKCSGVAITFHLYFQKALKKCRPINLLEHLFNTYVIKNEIPE